MKTLLLVALLLVGLNCFSQTDESSFSKNDPDQTAFLYSKTKDDPIKPVSNDSLVKAFKDLKKACSDLIDVTVGKTNTYKGIVKDAKNLQRKIENSYIYKKSIEEINSTETVKGIKKDIEEYKKSQK